MNVKYRYIHKKGQWNQISSRRNYLINIANDQLWCAVNVRIVNCTEYYKIKGSDLYWILQTSGQWSEVLRGITSSTSTNNYCSLNMNGITPTKVTCRWTGIDIHSSSNLLHCLNKQVLYENMHFAIFIQSCCHEKLSKTLWYLIE